MPAVAYQYFFFVTPLLIWMIILLRVIIRPIRKGIDYIRNKI